MNFWRVKKPSSQFWDGLTQISTLLSWNLRQKFSVLMTICISNRMKFFIIFSLLNHNFIKCKILRVFKICNLSFKTGTLLQMNTNINKDLTKLVISLSERKLDMNSFQKIFWKRSEFLYLDLISSKICYAIQLFKMLLTLLICFEESIFKDFD